MTTIQIERLTQGTLLHIPELHRHGLIIQCDDFGTVDSIEDDGEGFLLTLEFSLGHFEHHYVPYGETVEYGGRGQPKLLSDELVAPFHRCREIDERPLLASVADALGLQLQMAAE